MLGLWRGSPSTKSVSISVSSIGGLRAHRFDEFHVILPSYSMAALSHKNWRCHLSCAINSLESIPNGLAARPNRTLKNGTIPVSPTVPTTVDISDFTEISTSRAGRFWCCQKTKYSSSDIWRLTRLTPSRSTIAAPVIASTSRHTDKKVTITFIFELDCTIFNDCFLIIALRADDCAHWLQLRNVLITAVRLADAFIRTDWSEFDLGDCAEIYF